MALNFKRMLAVPPADGAAASVYGLPLAHMAYRIGCGGHLLRAKLPVALRGGLLVADSGGFDGRGNAQTLCNELLRECTSRGFDGVICNFDGPALPVLGQLVGLLGAQTAQRGWHLYVTEGYARFSQNARVLISSALSGGSLKARLLEAAGRYGVGRICLATERVREDFFLPSPAGSGTALTAEGLERLISQRGPSVFFSQELCCHYFTYMNTNGSAHFVLFDDGASLRKKWEIARGVGIETALVAYPEVADVMGEILR
ncbi:MAG: hypothetical protein RSG86_01220 [Oscillospiraceae bacterium]